MAEQIDLKAELKAATDRVLASKSRRKLVVAGPGAGKTYLFRELLKSADGSSEQRLVLTFINTLKDDLESEFPMFRSPTMKPRENSSRPRPRT
jgi:superfamily II DNA or RNA helicase